MVIKYLLVGISLTFNLYPQLLQEEVYKVSSTENKISEIRQISPTGFALILETDNNIKNYYLVNLFDKKEKKLLFSSQQERREVIRFSENSRFITYSITEGDRYAMKIYDTKDGKIKEINNPNGDIIYASVISMDNILYELRPPKDYPKIYLLDGNTNNIKLIGDGMTPMWSPDGKWFLARKAEYEKSNTKSKKVKLEGYEIVKKPIYSIYNYQGQKILDIKNHENINFIQWSHSSDKIVFTKLGIMGFYIVYLKFSNNIAEIEKEYHFKGFTKKEENVVFVDNPTWSPNGNWISFVKSIEDGHSVLERSIYIHNTSTNQQREIINLKSETLQEIEWISDYELLTIEERNNKSNDKVVNKINIPFLKTN